MTNFYKDELICDAIKESIVEFGKRNELNGMEYFAELFGYNGNNKSIQLHNRLSPSNNEKFLKVEELFFIMKQMDDSEQKRILDAISSKFGFFVKEAARGDVSICASVEMSVQMGAFEVQGLLGLFADEILADLNDGRITKDEAKRMDRICTNMREKLRGIQDALQETLGR